MAEIGKCLAAIVALSNVTPGYEPKFENAGALKATRDPLSQEGLKVINPVDENGGVVLDGNGDPTVNIKYYTNSATALVTSPVCTGTDAPAPQSTSFSLDKYLAIPGMTFKHSELQQLCGDAAKIYQGGTGMMGVIKNTPVMNEMVAALMPEIRKLVGGISQVVTTELATAAGFNSRMAVPSAVAQDVTLFKSDGEKSIAGWSTVLQDLQYNEMTGAPVIVLGGGTINRYAMALGWGCCSDGGTDYQKVLATSGQHFYFDRNVDTLIGQDDFLVMAPTTAMTVSRSRYKIAGKDSYRVDNTEYGSFQLDEFPGFTFDIIAVEEGCVTPKTTFIVSASFGTFIAPARYGAGDPLSGVNGIVRYNAVTEVAV